ncbi:MAG TPA: hypothetical protein VGB00_09410 [Pyrinomonadaceae bacterium]|jgi:hypothetical protein
MKQLQFKQNDGGTGVISLADIEKMEMPEFIAFEGRLLSMRRERRYDVAIWEDNTTILPAHFKEMFRTGVNQKDTYATSDTEFLKSLIHTNMERKGEFAAGSIVIVKNVEAEFYCTGGTPTTQLAGVVTNAKASFPSYIAPAMLTKVWNRQTYLEFKRGKDTVVEGLLENFPTKTGLTGAIGANSDAIVQNVLYSLPLMPNPQTFTDGQDFYVNVKPLAASFDNTNATGVGQELVVKVTLETLELNPRYL